MKKEYDFSKALRGKFYRPNARHILPIYLDAKNQEFVEGVAKRRKTDVTAVVNQLIRGDKELAKALD
jgi:hypothetical protein